MAGVIRAITHGLSRINPVAFRIGPLSVHWYGLAYLTGFIVGYFIIRFFARRWKLGLSDDDLLTILLVMIIAGVGGSRLFYCLFYNPGYYWAHPLDIFKTWDGGMSFHGSIIGAVIGLVITARKLKQPFARLADLCVIALPFGLLLGRLANFINGELWGRVTTVPWGVVFPAAGALPRHPSALYEAALEGVVLFTVMVVLGLRRRIWPRGFLTGVMMTLYSIFRVFVEFFREPDAQLGFLLKTNWLTMGMVLSLPLFITGVGFMVWSFKHKDKDRTGLQPKDKTNPEDTGGSRTEARRSRRNSLPLCPADKGTAGNKADTTEARAATLAVK